MDVIIELNSSNGQLAVIFHNQTTRSVTLRGLFPPFDVVIENDEGNRAEYYLSLPYGAKVKRILLEPGQRYQTGINLPSDFIYPKEGTYTVWVDYDSSKTTASYDRDAVDPIQCTSNRIRFPIIM